MRRIIREDEKVFMDAEALFLQRKKDAFLDSKKVGHDLYEVRTSEKVPTTGTRFSLLSGKVKLVHADEFVIIRILEQFNSLDTATDIRILMDILTESDCEVIIPSTWLRNRELIIESMDNKILDKVSSILTPYYIIA